MLFRPRILLWAAATAIGSYGGFPDPPNIIKHLVVKEKIFRWFLLFVLIWQGGASAATSEVVRIIHSVLIVLILFLLRTILDSIYFVPAV